MKPAHPLLLVAVVAALMSAPAIADDFAPPDWRGDPLSYFAEWEFVSSFKTSPDLESSMGGDQGEYLYPLAGGTHIDVDGEGWGWVDLGEGDGGISCPGRPASFAINTINWVDELPEKLIRVQITFEGVAPAVLHAQGFTDPDEHGGSGPLIDHGQFPAGPAVIFDENHFYQDIVLFPNPDWEQIVVNVPDGAIVDEIIVDTISIPEPATLGLLSLAALAFVRRRRR